MQDDGVWHGPFGDMDDLSAFIEWRDANDSRFEWIKTLTNENLTNLILHAEYEREKKERFQIYLLNQIGKLSAAFESTPQIAAEEIEKLKKTIRSQIARDAALASHAEDYKLRNEAIEYWASNINPRLSNEKAANHLARIFPVEQRTLAKYVAAAKKRKSQGTESNSQ